MKTSEWRWSTESARWQTGKGWEATKRPATLYADGNEYQNARIRRLLQRAGIQGPPAVGTLRSRKPY